MTAVISMNAFKVSGLIVLATLIISTPLLYLGGQATKPFSGAELAGVAGHIEAAAIALPVAINEPVTGSQPQQLTKEQLYALAVQFTVEVWITIEDGSRAPATGIVVGAGDAVLTNAHVVAGNPSPTIRVRDAGGGEIDYPGQVVASDRARDMALIALVGAPLLPVAPLADSTAEVRVRDKVYVFGSPVGYHWKMTDGEVIELASECGLRQLRCIRTAEGAMHPGNSGGPLLNGSGDVIGLNRAIQQSTGQGVSIPVEQVRDFLATKAIS